MAVVNHKRFAQNALRMNRELNPCPGRTNSEREFITRRLIEITDALSYHLEILNTLGPQPLWLPEAVITPHHELMYLDSRESYENTERDEYGYVVDMYDRNQRATNRVRAATWYKNNDGALYMTVLIIVSPLPCDEWGALPLTLGQWRIIIPEMIATHMHWKWVHAVRKYWNDTGYEVGGTFGWHLEKCNKLTKDHAELCTGQAIYSQAVRKYLEHASEG